MRNSNANILFTTAWLKEYEGWEEVETVNLFTELLKDGKKHSYSMIVRDNDFPNLVTIYRQDTGNMIYRQYVKTIAQYNKEVKCLLK